MKRFFVLLGLCFLLGGCAAASDPALGWVRAYSAGEITANPMAVDGKVVKDSDLSGLRLENLTLRNTTFWRSWGKDVVLRNVTFENCRFINVRLKGGVMENVTFKGGLLTCDYDRDNLPHRTLFSGVALNGLVFDGASLENLVMEVRGGSVTLRNMHSIRALEPLIRGTDTALVLDNCIFIRVPAIAALGGTSTLLVRDSTFADSRIGPSLFREALFERSAAP
jgi:hypothetical protein